MIRNKLKSYRHKHEMNQREFSAFLGVNHSLYNRWEKQHGQPSREWLFKLAAKLECKIEDLITLE